MASSSPRTAIASRKPSGLDRLRIEENFASTCAKSVRISRRCFVRRLEVGKFRHIAVTPLLRRTAVHLWQELFECMKLSVGIVKRAQVAGQFRIVSCHAAGGLFHGKRRRTLTRTLSHSKSPIVELLQVAMPSSS